MATWTILTLTAQFFTCKLVYTDKPIGSSGLSYRSKQDLVIKEEVISMQHAVGLSYISQVKPVQPFSSIVHSFRVLFNTCNITVGLSGTCR